VESMGARLEVAALGGRERFGHGSIVPAVLYRPS
jgi:hypothetical protein